MALVVEAGGPTPPKTDTPPEITNKAYDSNLIDRKEWVGVGITTQLDGSPWELEHYYQQVLGASQAPSPPQLTQPSVYQQYRDLRDYEIRVTSALSPNQDPEEGAFEVQGEANIFPSIVPIQGDTLVARGPDGKMCYFVITDVKRLTIYKRSAYSISYTQKGYYTSAVAEFFQTRAVETLYFRKDYLRVGKYPFLTTTEVASHGKIRDIRSALIDRMNRQFYFPSVMGYPVPEQLSLTYDPFLTSAWRDLIEFVRDYQEVKLTLHNIKGSTDDRTITLWDVLLRRKQWIPDLVTKAVVKVPTSNMSANPTLFSIRHTVFQYVLVSNEIGTFPGSLDMLNPVNGVALDPWAATPPVPDTDPYPSADPPIMNPVGKDGTYMLSQAFYDGLTENMSVMEREVQKAVNNEPMDLATLFRINDALPSLGPLERYYATALLYCLLSLYEWG